MARKWDCFRLKVQRAESMCLRKLVLDSLLRRLLQGDSFEGRKHFILAPNTTAI